MKRIEAGTQKPNFIGCWDIENKKLCNEIVSFFESNKELSKEGTTTLGKNIKTNVEKYLNIFKDYPYIFNLGHGVLPETKPEIIEYIINIVRNKK